MGVILGVAGVLRTAFYAAPWAWLLTLLTLLVLTIVQVGHFPSYGDPDPKQVEGAYLLYWGVYLLMIPAMVSPLIVAMDLIGRFASKARPLMRDADLWYGLGFALFAAVAFGNAFGLMSWVLD